MYFNIFLALLISALVNNNLGTPSSSDEGDIAICIIICIIVDPQGLLEGPSWNLTGKLIPARNSRLSRRFFLLEINSLSLSF